MKFEIQEIQGARAGEEDRQMQGKLWATEEPVIPAIIVYCNPHLNGLYIFIPSWQGLSPIIHMVDILNRIQKGVGRARCPNPMCYLLLGLHARGTTAGAFARQQACRRPPWCTDCCLTSALLAHCIMREARVHSAGAMDIGNARRVVQWCARPPRCGHTTASRRLAAQSQDEP